MMSSESKLVIEDLGPEYNYKSLRADYPDLPVDQDFDVDRDINIRGMISNVLTPELILRVLAQYSLDTMGIHGTAHWMRVRRNGLIIAQKNGADARIVELFALFHDCQRIGEGWDESHGVRGAELAYRFWRDGLFELNSEDFELLHYTCCYHTGGGNQPENPTIEACWDADRLDLWRVGIRPLPYKLCSPIARNPELIEWCMARSERWLKQRWRSDQ